LLTLPSTSRFPFLEIEADRRANESGQNWQPLIESVFESGNDFTLVVKRHQDYESLGDDIAMPVACTTEYFARNLGLLHVAFTVGRRQACRYTDATETAESLTASVRTVRILSLSSPSA
jgi:hypothetical protein